ncbi:MAG: multidrug efflux SMR transporter [Phycisphaerales bacterium]|nr:multidrug efflux SMR transporter [Phycisphaerales bacterium]
MTWGILLLASVFECTWAISMKFANGFRNLRWSIIMFLAMVASVVLLAIAAREIPMGTAYAVWTGLGAVGVAAFGMIRLGESKSPARIACLALIIVGVIGLRLSGAP